MQILYDSYRIFINLLVSFTLISTQCQIKTLYHTQFPCSSSDPAV